MRMMLDGYGIVMILVRNSCSKHMSWHNGATRSKQLKVTVRRCENRADRDVFDLNDQEKKVCWCCGIIYIKKQWVPVCCRSGQLELAVD